MTDRWRAELEAWAIPEDLLAAAEESPYGWPQELWKRRSELARAQPEPITTRIVRRLAGSGGSVIDVGAGRGRASLPLALDGHPLTVVEKDHAMLAGLAEEAAGLGVAVTTVEGRWPDVAGEVPAADVVMCAHVVYDVVDIGPFVAALDDHARSGVVIELTETHPWSDLAPLYLTLHGLERPTGPGADDLAEVVRSVIGTEPTLERWERPGQLWFEDWDELCDYYGRRLVLPSARRGELRSLLDERSGRPWVGEKDGRLWAGDGDRRLVTLWWRRAAPDRRSKG